MSDQQPDETASGRAAAESTYARLLSHQLKSPLNAIQSLLDTIAQGMVGQVDPRALSLVERAMGRTREAREMISDLLDYELLSERQAMRTEEFDLFEILRRAAAQLSNAAEEKEQSLQAEVPDGQEARLSGDGHALEQAFGNLVENAIKYTPERGTVRVAVSIEPGGKECTVRVSDTGPGILPEELTRIFEPFFRSSRHRSTVAGTGLGLAIARRIIERHHGTITVASAAGQGTTFSVTLPLSAVVAREQPAGNRRRVVIIGGVTAGPKAAARLRRLDDKAEITMIERGEFLSYAGCGLPHYLSGRVESLRALMATADNTVRNVHFFQAFKDVRVLNGTLATRIDRDRREVSCRDLASSREFAVPYDDLVLATGARPNVPPIPGIDQPGIYTVYSLESAEAIKKLLSAQGSLDVSVIGAGFIGISLAESLIEAGARVTIMEKEPSILRNYFDPDIARKIQRELGRKAIKVLTSVTVKEIRDRGGQKEIVASGGIDRADLVILATGVSPNAELAAAAGLAIDPSGGVRVNEYLQTSDPGIFAIGDCAETVNLITGKHEFLPLGSVSTKMGRIVADTLAGRKTPFPGSIGTAMLRIFDVNAARTGLTHEAARRAGFDADSSVITGLDRPHYSTGSAPVCLKVTADRATRRLLGAQGFGVGDVVRRIEVLAVAISRGLTLEDCFALDLGYSPAFNTAIDISQTACLVLANKLDGLIRTTSVDELEHGEAANIVDVSPYAEHAQRSIPGSINVPLENIRRDGIPFGKQDPVLLYSRTSSSAYEAYRFLDSRGYARLSVLEGGYMCWQR